MTTVWSCYVICGSTNLRFTSIFHEFLHAVKYMKETFKWVKVSKSVAQNNEILIKV